jgi:7SK snRNA methylphosphate capping enzyme
MATATAAEDAPPAGNGAKGEPNRKRGYEQGAATARGGGGEQKRKKKEVFIYGNYKNYYGYRVSTEPPLYFLSPRKFPWVVAVHA